MENIGDLQIGKAGEYLVCADMISSGMVAFPSEQGLHYDVVCDVSGVLLRVQVKTTRTNRPIPQRSWYTPAYLFHTRRCGKGGRVKYEDSDIDMVAVVVLDKKLIGYLPISEVRQTMQLRDRDMVYKGNKSGVYIQDLTLSRAVAICKERLKQEQLPL